MEAKTKLRVGSGQHERRISRHLYAHFIEHLGGCICDGIYVGDHPHIANIDGLRCDTIEALKKLQIPAVRWPGGLFADNYHWRDGIGPKSSRPIRQNLGWNSFENNQFGTHEFMQFCELIGAEPYLCLNLGSGTVEEAAAWAEYCNCALETTLTRERAANGHPTPFNVKYWSLGNEPGYPMDGMMRPGYYADVARQFAGYVKFIAAQAPHAQDPRFRQAGVKMTLADYRCAREAVAEGRNAYFDLLAVHLYAGRTAPPEASPLQQYRAMVAELPEWRRQLAEASALAAGLSTDEHAIELAIDEWGVWKHEATPLNGLQQSCTLGDALFAAAALHLFCAEPCAFMANLAQTINVLAAVILTDDEQFCRTPLYHVFDMLKVHQDAWLVPCELDKNDGDACYVIASQNDTGPLHLSVVNLSPDTSQNLHVELGQSVMQLKESWVLTGESIAAQNSFDDEKIAPRAFDTPKNSAKGFDIAVPACSLVLLVFE